ncbi:MAG: recombinase family protein [Firmicutes bacterium]|uniref:Recombinase family protein n=1 Tax=Candidatus Scybalomonas excrementavium TaxID=2840943 RepID=A0A9D9I0H9_9FIRM|nr:recombinase family protein [Candidatus Scybalomonas excrementavium]
MNSNEQLRSGALYIRVSTDKQEELSPDAQKRLLLEYAKKNNILISNEHIYMENGISGRKAEKRPEFLKMIATAKSKPKPFDVILVWKFSRFARNQEESIVYKSLLRKQCNIDVLSVSEPLVEGPFGSLIERIIEWMDEYYSTRLSGEVFRGMTEKALRGGYQARPPLGYRIEKTGEPPVIVEEEAKIIRIIFHKFVHKSASYYTIARYLNSFGYKTNRGKDFERRSIEYILQNPTYIGKIRWNRTENATSQIKPKDEWIITDGTHPAIISEELFNQAQEIIASRRQPKKTRPASTYKHWASGLTKCSACGRTLTISTHYKIKKDGTKTPHYSFNCYGYAKGKCLTSHAISSRKLEKGILDILYRDMNVSDLNDLAFETIETNSIESDEIYYIQARLKELDTKEKRIKEAYREGIDTLEEYKENKMILQKERTSLEETRRSLLSATKKTPEVPFQEQLRSLCDVLENDAFSIEQKNHAATSIISYVIFDKPNDSLKIYYKSTL